MAVCPGARCAKYFRPVRSQGRCQENPVNISPLFFPPRPMDHFTQTQIFRYLSQVQSYITHMAFELNYAVLSDPLQASIYITLSRRIAFQITLSEAFRCMAAGHLLGSTSTANIALASQTTMNNKLTWQVGLRKSSALWTPKKTPPEPPRTTSFHEIPLVIDFHLSSCPEPRSSYRTSSGTKS